ncbi:MAG: hypothetical protein IKM11_02235 [Oscillospiraceae bacterium]|nr:hypothetical protein [Oscillospiraceae bacterium]
MKTTLRNVAALLAAAMLLIAVGCGVENKNTDIKNDTPQTETTAPSQLLVTFNEPHGSSYQDKGGWETTVGNLTVQFTSEISKEEGDAAVTEIGRVAELIEEQFGAVDTPYEIRIRSGSYAPWSNDGVLYIGYDNLKTQEFTIGLGQMLFGHEVNYGVYYGFGTILAQAAGYATEEIAVPEEQALTLCEISPYHLDMNYACFVPAYADEEILPKVKALAIDFYQSLSQEERQELLTNYSDELYREYRNKYLAAHGQEPYDNADLDGISFYPCGSQMRLAWEDPCAVYYLHKDYTVRYGVYDEIMGVGDYLNSGYENFRYLVSCYRLQAEEMDRIAGYLETEDKEQKIDVLFIRDGTGEVYSGANYFFVDNLIKMYSHSPYAHEYIHYMTRDGASVVWLQELFACYFTECPGDPRIYWPIVCNRDSFESADPAQPSGAKLLRLMEAVEIGLGHPFSWENEADYHHMNDAFVANFNQIRKVKDEGGVAAHTSFVHYLVDLVGEEDALWAVYYDTPVETFGKNWDQLISDWAAKLLEEHSWMTDHINMPFDND